MFPELDQDVNQWWVQVWSYVKCIIESVAAISLGGRIEYWSNLGRRGGVFEDSMHWHVITRSSKEEFLLRDDVGVAQGKVFP